MKNSGSNSAAGSEDKSAPRMGQESTGSKERTSQSPKASDSPASNGQAQTPPASGNRNTQAQTPSSGDRNASGTSSQTNVNVNLTSDQRTRIRQTVIKESNAPRVSRSEVSFSLHVGTVVPRTVRVAVLPVAVVEIHPAWRGYSYILVGDEIVILEPATHKIVAIIPA